MHPTRFYLDVGLLEPYTVPVNPHFRDVLQARGYWVTHREFLGDHTWMSRTDTIADGLIALTSRW